MRRKYFALNLVLLFFLILSSTAVWAEAPSALIVVRASNGTLWKATCLGATCTPFSSFPGNLASQPTVYWDEKLEKYVIWGRASDSSIWRATFNSAGNFLNDWVKIPGATASPVGAAGSDLTRPGYAYASKGSKDVATISDDCNNMTNLASFTITQKRYGRILVFASGNYDPTTNDKWVRVCISAVSGGGLSTCDSEPYMIENDTVANFESEKVFATQEAYGGQSADTYTYYLKACRETGATGTLWFNEFIGIYVSFGL